MISWLSNRVGTFFREPVPTASSTWYPSITATFFGYENWCNGWGWTIGFTVCYNFGTL